MSTHDEGEAMDITRYAEVMAHLRHFPADKSPEVIARLGIRQRDWQAAAKRWQAARDAERGSGEMEVTARFGRVIAETRAKLDARQPSLESLGSLPGPEGGSAAATAAGGEQPDRASAALSSAGQAPSASCGPPQGDRLSPRAPEAPTYLARPETGGGALGVAQPLRVRVPAELTGTVGAVEAPSGSALPFVAGRADLPPSRVRAPAELTGTAGVVEAPRGPTLPFVLSARAEPAARPRVPAALTGTVDAVGTSGGSALPFVEQTSPASNGPQLTLEQYAVLRAQLAVKGEDDQETLRLFGVTSPAAKVALQTRFAEGFRQDGAAQARFVELVRTLVNELRRQAPGR